MSLEYTSRHLTRYEIALFPKNFAKAFDIRSVTLENRAYNSLTRKKILVRGSKIYWPNAPRDFTLQSTDIQAVLMHELCHVWQYSTGRLTVFKYLFNPANWFYRYTLTKHRKFYDYPIEKQADLLQDWFLLNTGSHPQCFSPRQQAPSCAEINRLIPFKWDYAF